jgi:hypothetical protein
MGGDVRARDVRVDARARDSMHVVSLEVKLLPASASVAEAEARGLARAGLMNVFAPGRTDDGGC